MRPVFKAIIYSLENHSEDWVDEHKPRGCILRHKNGVMIYGGCIARIVQPQGIMPKFLEKRALRKAIRKATPYINLDAEKEVLATLEGELKKS